ncbi:conserved hypothetical protein [Ricinus communis]|uniref:Uncharacterized protein n=1 Tax=Ricinus communis TaxID=3988 RepID=B9S5D7_RICCO|nr:conserved hypothetical protein [Ricinus communis]
MIVLRDMASMCRGDMEGKINVSPLSFSSSLGLKDIEFVVEEEARFGLALNKGPMEKELGLGVIKNHMFKKMRKSGPHSNEKCFKVGW